MQSYLPAYIASDYGAGTYDTQNYSPAGSSTSTSTASSGGTLADTGTAILVFVTLACVIIFVALLVRLWKKPAKNKSAPTS